MVISETIKIVLTYNKNRIIEQYRFGLVITSLACRQLLGLAWLY